MTDNSELLNRRGHRGHRGGEEREMNNTDLRLVFIAMTFAKSAVEFIP